MLEILHKLGINTPDIIAQMLVFGIVYLILSKYAFGPVTALLEERRRRIFLSGLLKMLVAGVQLLKF
jgi:hypothetical protein